MLASRLMDRVRVSTAEGYSLWAASYDAYPNGLVWIEEPIVRALVGDVAGKRVLDAGCGTGRHLGWLIAQGAAAIGVDPSEAMLHVAREKHAGAELLVGSLASLPVPEASFDVVLNALVLEHVEALDRAFAELARPLRRDGRLVVSVYHPFFLLKGVPPHFVHGEHGVEYELPSHVHLVSDYLRALRGAGLALDQLVEPIVDDALIATYPRFEKHRGHPLAIVLAATRA